MEVLDAVGLGDFATDTVCGVFHTPRGPQDAGGGRAGVAAGPHQDRHFLGRNRLWTHLQLQWFCLLRRAAQTWDRS